MKIFANLYLQITRRELPVDSKIPFTGTEITRMQQNLKPVLVCSCIFKAMKANVTKPVY